MKSMLIKALRDLKLSKGRTLLTLLGILVGISSLGMVLTAYSILVREMDKNYMDTNPASMVFHVSNLDERAGAVIQKEWPNTSVDIGTTVLARISRGDGTYGIIYLRAVNDFQAQSVDTFALEKGRYPNGTSEFVIERDCLKVLPNLKTGVGESVSISLPGGAEKEVVISGTVHAPELAPASMENYSYGFVSPELLKSLGYTGAKSELRLVSYDNRMDQSKMQDMADQIKSRLMQNGYIVNRVDVPVPGKHPHADQLSSLLFLLQAFAVISLLTACLIIINLLNFLMSRQAKQIAIQKALGGSTRQIALPYFLYIMFISAGAILISIPISILFGNAYVNFAAGILNFNINSYAVPVWVFIVQILAGILVPVLSAAWPIYKSCSVSVKDGLAEKVTASKRKNTQSENKKSVISIGLALPVRNLFRKRGRTALAILALLAGGMLFMTAQNMTASIDKTTNASMDAFKWDYDIRLAENYDQESILKVINSINGVSNAEIWQNTVGFFETDSEKDSPNYAVKIVPPNSSMMDMPSLDSSENTIVINQVIADAEKWTTPGQTVTLQIGDITSKVKISAIVTEPLPIATVYISAGTYSKLFGSKAQQTVFAHANTRDQMAQRNITKDIEAKFKAANIHISENWNVYALKKALADHLKIIITFLSVMAMLAVAVGGLGIGATIGINISERRYETGVMRAIGAKPSKIYAQVLTEVTLMGLIGCFAGAALSYPLSIVVGNYFGQIFLNSNLNNVFSWSGSAIWLAISVSVALISGFIPARRAASAPLREMLSYE